jgi:hypothetical protein
MRGAKEFLLEMKKYLCQDKTRGLFAFLSSLNTPEFLAKTLFNRNAGHTLQQDWSNECGNWAPTERANCTNDWQKVDAVRPSFSRVRRPFFSYYFPRKLRVEPKMLAGAGAKNRLVT